jgi:hypothetical protein
VHRLAEAGANLELPDKQGKKPMYYANMQDDRKMANALVELGNLLPSPCFPVIPSLLPSFFLP